MIRIYLVRHGEVEGNSGDFRTFAGWADLPLTERGHAQADAVAQRLAGEALGSIFSSDLQRARVTAERIAARHGLANQVDQGFREVSYGSWEGLGETDIRAKYDADWQARLADPERNPPTGGESLQGLWERLEPAFGRVAESAATTGTAVIVAHNGPIRLLLSHLLGMPANNFRRLHSSNCGLSCVEQRSPAGPFTVVCVNETAHLSNLSDSSTSPPAATDGASVKAGE